MYRILLTLLFIVVGQVSQAHTSMSKGQNFNYSFTQLSINQGLSQASVTSVTTDRKGRLWIGTQNGLNYYFQHQLTTFVNNENDSLSLPNNYINHIAEDSLGNIWIATAKEMIRYNKDHHFIPTGYEYIYSSLCIEGGILFGSENLILHYDYKSHTMDSIRISQSQPVHASEYRIQKMVWLDHNNILIGTKEQGIFLYNHHTKHLTRFTTDIHHLLISLYVASDNNIYASFYGNGIYCYNREGKMIKYYTSRTSSLNNNYVLDIIEHQKQLWIATDGGGINILDLESDQFRAICHVPGDNSSLPVNSIILLYKDPNGNLWAGSVRGGLFNIKETYIRTYKDVALNNSNGVSDKSIISLYDDTDNKLWIGTDGGGINLYDPHADQFTHFPLTYGDKVASITKLSDTELMVSLYTKGIFIFNKNTGTYRPFTIVDETTNYKECFYGYLPLAHKVAEDKIYIISYSPWVYHLQSGKFSLMPSHNLNTEGLRLVYSNEQFSLLKRNNQIFYVAQENDSITLLCEIDKKETITALSYEDNNIWIGSDRGLGYYNMKDKEFHHIHTNYFNNISSLIGDKKGRLWICAHNKLFSYLIEEKKFILWNSSDGFLPNEILASYYVPRNPNFIYLTGAEGLVKINANIPYNDMEIPQISLADIKYNGCSLTEQQLQNHTIRIPWNYNSLSVHIQTKSKDVFQKDLFRYTISGQSQQTIETFDAELPLSSLSPGTYNIQASCSTKNGDYTDPVPVIRIIITPPWYKSNWFITLCAVLLFAVAIMLILWKLQKQRKKIRNEIGDFVQTVLYNVLEDKEGNEKEKEPEEATDTGNPCATPVNATMLSESDIEFMNKLNQTINENLANEQLTIKYLTLTMTMSRASLYNKVKQLTGLGVNEYINRLRIERSVYLLTHTSMSISEISYEVGFSYPRYFSTSFKQLKGMTPTRFKEENKKKE